MVKARIKTRAKALVFPLADIRRFTLYILLAALFYALITVQANAVVTPMGTVLCDIVYMIYGNLGRGLATLAIIIVGVGATLGKVSWGLAITVAIGISVIANAGTIMFMLTGASGC